MSDTAEIESLLSEVTRERARAIGEILATVGREKAAKEKAIAERDALREAVARVEALAASMPYANSPIYPRDVRAALAGTSTPYADLVRDHNALLRGIRKLGNWALASFSGQTGLVLDDKIRALLPAEVRRQRSERIP